MTQLDNVNRALAEIGTRSRLTVVDNSTTEGLYASLLYPMLRDSMLRMGDYDWSMDTQSAFPAAVPTNSQWTFVYQYPLDTVRIRQAIPTVVIPLDPKPIAWNVLNSVGHTFVGSKTEIKSFIVTINTVSEASWDTQFTDAFIRNLAASLTMALENRMEASETILKNALTFAGIANMRDS